jgi:hypothetical protein
MLSGRVWGRLPRLAAAGLVLAAAGLVAGTEPAAAGPTDKPECIRWLPNPGGSGHLPDYSNCGGGSGDPGEDGGGNGGGGGEPTCDWSLIEGRGEDRWCEGENACWANIPSAVYPDPEDWPPGQPSEDAVYIFKLCYGPDGTEAYNEWTWRVPNVPSIEDLAWEAYGRLRLPEFTLAFNPYEQAIIYKDTWWWVEGPTDSTVLGSSAAGLVAIAEPNRVEVDPGDGSGTINCGWVTAKSDECAHAYQKASDEGYPAEARLVYDVRFENNGTPIEVAGAPDSVESDWVGTSVPVREIQAIVR